MEAGSDSASPLLPGQTVEGQGRGCCTPLLRAGAKLKLEVRGVGAARVNGPEFLVAMQTGSEKWHSQLDQ